MPEVVNRQRDRSQKPIPTESHLALGKTNNTVYKSVVQVLAGIAQLAWMQIEFGRPPCGYWLHTQYEILRRISARVDVTPANPQGLDDECAGLARTPEKDECDVISRGYVKARQWDESPEKREQRSRSF